MKPDEIKLRVKKYADELIDELFPASDTFGKLKGATAKFWVEQNVWRLDDILNQFVDCNGEIDTKSACRVYSDCLFDAEGHFSVDVKKVAGNSGICKYLPDSVILFTKNDMEQIFGFN